MEIQTQRRVFRAACCVVVAVLTVPLGVLFVFAGFEASLSIVTRVAYVATGLLIAGLPVDAVYRFFGKPEGSGRLQRLVVELAVGGVVVVGLFAAGVLVDDVWG